MRLLIYGWGCYGMGLVAGGTAVTNWVAVLIGAWIGLGALMLEGKKKP